jgi:hypothetical protein
VQKPYSQEKIREEARLFEAALPTSQRKRLGQFFTGLQLGKLLAHLALAPRAGAVVDPMAGHGDLLDAIYQAARECGKRLSRLDGIEIDPLAAELCRKRLGALSREGCNCEFAVVGGNAFTLSTINALPQRGYDIAIANPPYVRYQSQASEEPVRRGLISIVEAILEGYEKTLWRTLTEGYSGLADLSLPASLLAGLLVVPGGRLALVLPATWRTREYGDVLRYLLLRCFQLEYIVEDTQPGWFSSALVRTNLIVARRLHADEVAVPLGRRGTMPSARFLRIAPQAADARSLVGEAFGTEQPEMEMACWLAQDPPMARPGLSVEPLPLERAWADLGSRVAKRSWFQSLEPDNLSLPLFSTPTRRAFVLPESVRGFVRDRTELSLTSLEEAGILVGQGLRTGCNWFFYVDALDERTNDLTLVRASSAFDRREFLVPSVALRPVLRRQSDLEAVECGGPVPGRVLDLRRWVLPEDADEVAKAADTYHCLGATVPQIMPRELAAYIRHAANTGPRDQPSKVAPKLSAVRTNVRPHKPGVAAPRFWYMLPDFMPRHEPAAFVARVNHGAPLVECAKSAGLLVDANFSTFWTKDKSWSPFALKALLNSAWCQLFMEALGTPMGGGALKLEAIQLKQLPLPLLSDESRKQLHRAGQGLQRNEPATHALANAVMLNALQGANRTPKVDLVTQLSEHAAKLRQTRLRSAA